MQRAKAINKVKNELESNGSNDIDLKEENIIDEEIKQETIEPKKVINQLQDQFDDTLMKAKDIDISIEEKQLFDQQRYMKGNLTEWASNLEDRIYDLAEKALHQLNLNNKINNSEQGTINFSNPNQLSQNSIYCIGRITYDLNESEGKIYKLTKDNVYFEALANNQFSKVQLNIELLNSFSFFPGQLAVLKGKNPTGIEFIVEEILDNPPLLPTENMNVLGLFTLIAAGPFTFDDNLRFEPLKLLIDKVLSNPTPIDTLMLIGPFISEEHIKVKEGNYPGSQPTFISKISKPLSQLLLKLPKLKIILIPDVKDAFHPFNSFPQPPIKKGSSLHLLSPNIYCLSNPASVSLEKVNFFTMSLDILLAMSKVEFNKNLKLPRVFNLIEHLLNQHHPIPIYPIPEEFQFDLSNLNSIQFYAKPNVLILPSKLNTFCKFLSNQEVLAINPGFLCNGSKNGTYALLTMLPKQDDDIEREDDEDFIYRTQVEIIKL